MPTKILCNCDDVNLTDLDVNEAEFNKCENINIYEAKKNVRFKIDDFAHSILKKEISTTPWDLIDIALYVYCADSSVSRGEIDVHGKQWKRDFTLVIPVRNIEIWNMPKVREKLEGLLGFLSDEKYNFRFVSVEGKGPRQLDLNLRDQPEPFPDANCIALFSGGLDSLSGVIEDVKKNGKRPILVSHRSAVKIYNRQQRLAKLIRDENSLWEFPHISALATRMGSKAFEFTQRTRSFLYLSLAAAVAYETGISDIKVYENGVTSFNLPKSSSTVSTFASRTTHPKYVKMFQEFITEIFQRDMSVTNPFIFSTKAEVISKLNSNSFEKAIGASYSCTHTIASTSHQPHCGICSQCVDRRFSVIASDNEENDFPEGAGYEKNIFIDNLQEGQERFYSENYVRAAKRIGNMTINDFLQDYPEIYDSLQSLEDADNNFYADDALESVFNMLKRHSAEVAKVMKIVTEKNYDALYEGKLPAKCLIAFVGVGKHREEPLEDYARNLGEIIDKGIRPFYQDKCPQDEKDLQNAMQGVLAGAEQNLEREFPLLKYAVVGAKPDFATPDHKLFIEAKYLKVKSGKVGMIKDITSRITVYSAQGAHTLFYIFVKSGVHLDDHDLVSTLEKHENIYVKVTRG